MITCEQLQNVKVDLLERDVHQRTVARGFTKAVIHPLAADSGVSWAHFLWLKRPFVSQQCLRLSKRLLKSSSLWEPFDSCGEGQDVECFFVLRAWAGG